MTTDTANRIPCKPWDVEEIEGRVHGATLWTTGGQLVASVRNDRQRGWSFTVFHPVTRKSVNDHRTNLRDALFEATAMARVCGYDASEARR